MKPVTNRARLVAAAVAGLLSPHAFVQAQQAQADPEAQAPARSDASQPTPDDDANPNAATPPPADRPTSPENTPAPGSTPEDQPVDVSEPEAETRAPQRLDEKILDWGGYRSDLEERGIRFEGAYIADWSYNVEGGINDHSDTFRSLLDLRLSLDTGPLIGLPGGTFSIDLQNQAGGDGSASVGDIQAYDNIDADGRTQVSELWYQQQLFDDVVRVKVGKVDANSEFAFPEFGGEFVNSSYGFSPTVFVMPTYPDPAVSLNLFVYPTSWLYAGYGIYDGALADGVSTGNHSPKTVYREPDHYFQIAEAGVRWSLADEDALPGRFAVGGFYHNGDFTSFSGDDEEGTGGFYALVEQKIWGPTAFLENEGDQAGGTSGGGGERGVYAFAQYGWADEDVSDVAQHIGAGVVWVGPYAKENPDSLGLGVTAAFLSRADGSPYTESVETAIEGFYKYQALSYLSVKPDVQYIVHPGGDASLDDALVGTLRVELDF